MCLSVFSVVVFCVKQIMCNPGFWCPSLTLSTGFTKRLALATTAKRRENDLFFRSGYCWPCPFGLDSCMPLEPHSSWDKTLEHFLFILEMWLKGHLGTIVFNGSLCWYSVWPRVWRIFFSCGILRHFTGCAAKKK